MCACVRFLLRQMVPYELCTHDDSSAVSGAFVTSLVFLILFVLLLTVDVVFTGLFLRNTLGSEERVRTINERART